MSQNISFLNREGNKARYANQIIHLFKDHATYIEPFVGVGGIFFNKKLAKYNIINDYSKSIYDMYLVLKDEIKYNNLLYFIEITPINLFLFDYYKTHGKDYERIGSLFLSTKTSYLGRVTTIVYDQASLAKKSLISRLIEIKDIFFNYLKNTVIANISYDIFLGTLKNIDNKFIYCDPPYAISKGGLKDNKIWGGLNELDNLINILFKCKCNFAISEYSNPEVISLFNKYKLSIIYLKTESKMHQKIKNDPNKIEIIALNYDPKTSIKNQISLF